MKIFTSYFSNIKKLQKQNILPISIARFPPSWYSGLQFKTISPSTDILLNCKQNTKLYTERFNTEILQHLNPTEVYEQLTAISDNRDIALLCFEKPSDFCHRHLVASWLNDAMHLNIKEFRKDEDDTNQPLF